MSHPSKSNTFFSYGRRQKLLSSAIHELLTQEIDKHRQRYIEDRNIFRYHHGREWLTSHDGDQSFSKMHEMGAETTIHYRDIIDHDLSIIERHIKHLASTFGAQFAANLYESVGEAADLAGNVVDLAGGDLESGLKKMLEKLEFGVNRYGKPTPPEMHVGSAVAEKLRPIIAGNEGRIDLEVEELHARKEAQAIGREADRVCRFRL
jgi:hypothetical protein